MSNRDEDHDTIESEVQRRADIPSQAAIFKVHARQKYVKFLLVILLALMMVAVYYLLQKVISPPPKVYLKIYLPDTREYKHTSTQEINKYLQTHDRIYLQVKVIAKADYYFDHHNERVPRDYAQVRFLNIYNTELGTAFVKMEKNKKEFMEGEMTMIMDKIPNEDNTIQEDVFVVLTNKARSADKLQVRVPIQQ